MKEYSFVKPKVDLTQLAKELEAALNVKLYGETQTGYISFSAPGELKIFHSTSLNEAKLDAIVSAHVPKSKSPRLKLKAPDGSIVEYEIVD